MGLGRRCETIYFFIYVILGMGSRTLVRGLPILTPCTTPAETCLGNPGLGPRAGDEPQAACLLPAGPSSQAGGGSGLPGTHSGPDSSTVVCTGPAVPLMFPKPPPRGTLATRGIIKLLNLNMEVAGLSIHCKGMWGPGLFKVSFQAT